MVRGQEEEARNKMPDQKAFTFLELPAVLLTTLGALSAAWAAVAFGLLGLAAFYYYTRRGPPDTSGQWSVVNGQKGIIKALFITLMSFVSPAYAYQPDITYNPDQILKEKFIIEKASDTQKLSATDIYIDTSLWTLSDYVQAYKELQGSIGEIRDGALKFNPRLALEQDNLYFMLKSASQEIGIVSVEDYLYITEMLSVNKEIEHLREIALQYLSHPDPKLRIASIYRLAGNPYPQWEEDLAAVVNNETYHAVILAAQISQYLVNNTIDSYNPLMLSDDLILLFSCI